MPPQPLPETQMAHLAPHQYAQYQEPPYRSRSMGPTPRHEEYDGSMTLASTVPERSRRGGEVLDYAAEAEALRAERRADKEMRRAQRIRDGRHPRAADGELSLYDESSEKPVAQVRRDRKGRMSIVVPRRNR